MLTTRSSGKANRQTERTRGSVDGPTSSDMQEASITHQKRHHHHHHPHQHQVGEEPRVDTSPRVLEGGGFRHGDEGRASTRANPDNGVSRTGSRVLDEWRRKANQLLSRSNTTAAVQQHPTHSKHHQVDNQHHHQQHQSPPPPYQPSPQLHLQQQGHIPGISGAVMAPVSVAQQQRQQRRNSLGGENRERVHSFHEPKGAVPQHHRNSAVIANNNNTSNKTVPDMLNWNTTGYNRMASPPSSNPNSTRIHGQRSPSECDSRAENIYENVGQQKMALVSHEKSASSLSSCCSSPSADRLLQNNGGKSIPGESRVRPAFERERRSLRKLTKDSGYETSPYSESDYANMEWLSDQNSDRGLMSPSPTHTHLSSYPPYWDSLSDHEGPYPHYPSAQQRASWTQYQNQMERNYPGRSGHVISSRCKSAICPDSRDSGYISLPSKSQTRRLSTGEGWSSRSHSEQARELTLGRYSSTDSLSSYSSSSTSRYPATGKVVSAKSTPSLTQHQDGRLEAAPALAPSSNSLTGSMSSSRSTPNLDNEDDDVMVSRKFKKASVYEALASKSGLDFAPTIQGRQQWEQKERRDGSFGVQHQRSSSTSSCQSYHSRQASGQSTASDCTSSSGNSQSGHSRQVSGHSSYSEDEGRILSPRGEEGHNSDFAYHSRNGGHVSLPAFPSNNFLPPEGLMMEDFHKNHWARSQPELDHLSPSPSSPPPPAPPVRDGSSLKYMKYGSDHHEKYPSWPVGQSDGGQRSRQWTDGTNETNKDKVAAAYIRPKKYSQACFTQQLKTVVENAEKIGLEDPRFISALQGQYFSHLGNPPSDKNPAERSAGYEFDQVGKTESPYDREFSYRDYKVHSPPERDVPPEKLQKHRREEVALRNERQTASSSSPQNSSDIWWSATQSVESQYTSDLNHKESIERQKAVNSSPQNNSDIWWSADSQYSSDNTLVLSGGDESQDTPMLDRLRLESSRWSGDDKDGRGSNNGGAGGRDSITSTTSSQETLKWHGSNSDLSVHSDKQARLNVETVVHSARVQPPQRHNSESVLYYGADEACAIARSVSEGRRDSPPRQGSYATGDNSDVAPPLPRKTRQWSEQVQKNNYLNRIQMQVRPVTIPAEHSASAPGLRVASLAREEIQPPLNPEFAKPLSVAERIQDLERQARIRGSSNAHNKQANRPCPAASKVPQRQKVANGLGPQGSIQNTLQRGQSTSPPSAGPALETRMAYLDPEKKHKVSDPELKAIQKQAVWSFFERQTGISAHGRSNSKESLQFLSRRMAQSLPRDYMQEFKRLQQMQQNEDRKNQGPVTAVPGAAMGQTCKQQSVLENGHVDKRETNNDVGLPKMYHQSNGSSPSRSSSQNLQRHSKSPRSSNVSSASSSSSSSTGSSPTTPTASSSISSSPTSQLSRQTNVCYNTCTQTGLDVAAIEQGPTRVSSSIPDVPKEENVRNKRQDVTSLLKPSPSGDIVSKVSSPSNTSEDLKLIKGSGSQDQREKSVIDAEVKLPSLVKASSTRELRTSGGQACDSLPCNVPCEQTPTKSVGKSESSTVSSKDSSHSSLHNSKGDSGAEPSPSEDSYVPATECVEDVELRKIEESAKVLRNLLPSGSSGTYTPRTHRRLFLNHDGLRNSPSPSISCPSLSSRCSTPDLPLPPPPKTTDLELLMNDEPLPPPPSLNEMDHALAEQQTKSPSPNGMHRGTYLPYRGESQHAKNSYDNNNHQSLIPTGKMDKSLSPCTAWEQWHNIRQSNTTLVFHSGEMMPSKTNQVIGSKVSTDSINGQASTKNSDPSALSVGNGAVPSPTHNGKDKFVDSNLLLNPSISPVSRLKSTSSVESLRSVGSSNSGTSSMSCWQETEASLPSSSSSLSGSIPILLSDGQKSVSPTATGKNLKLANQLENQKSAEAMTQTTPSINKIGRKKREEELECERLSRDLINHLSGQDNALRHILVPAPEMKTMADYMEGIFEVDLKRRDVVQRRGTSSSSFSPPPALEQMKRMSGDVQLPADSAYFTTSESKAKFLTRYSKNMQQSQAASLGDVKNGSELDEKKAELVDSITRKLKILRLEQSAIKEEIGINEELGSAVSGRVEQLAKSNEVDKFKLHVEEIEKITSLLLGLSGRLARAQNALMTLSTDCNPDERRSLEAKRNKLCEQHEEAKKLKESIDRRSVQVSNFLHKYLSSEEYADYDHFIKMKAKLLMDSREIDDKIKLGEEQMLALRENLKT